MDPSIERMADPGRWSRARRRARTVKSGGCGKIGFEACGGRLKYRTRQSMGSKIDPRFHDSGAYLEFLVLGAKPYLTQ